MKGNNQMVPVTLNGLYHSARMLGLFALTKGKNGKVKSWRNVHPLYDCQPWSEGVGNREFDIAYLSGDELGSTSYVNLDFLRAALHRMHPCVYLTPKRV